MIQTFLKSDVDFKRAKTMIISKSSSLCQGGVDQVYIVKNSIPEADALIIAYDQHTTRHNTIRNELLGFAIIMKQGKHLYLDVICAQRVGKKIFEQTIQLARTWNVRTIQISSVPSAMPYWLKLGFVNHKSSCQWDPQLVAHAQQISKLQVKPGTSNNIIDTYLAKLISKKLTRVPCKTIPKCNIDGYTMTFCLDNIGILPFEKTSTTRRTSTVRSVRRRSVRSTTLQQRYNRQRSVRRTTQQQRHTRQRSTRRTTQQQRQRSTRRTTRHQRR